MVRVFLDIDIGDAAAHADAAAAHGRAQDFLAAVGPQYGLPGELQQLDEEGRAMLAEAYAADPSWSSKGACRGGRCCVVVQWHRCVHVQPPPPPP